MANIVVITQEEFKSRFIYDPKRDLIGTGGFAKVYKAIDNRSNKYVALKIFTGDSNVRYNILRELNQIRDVPKHINVIQIHQVIEVKIDGKDIDGTSLKYQVGILEFANAGTLEDVFKNNASDSFRKKILIDILSGIAHLHNNNIVHRDLKPNNILLHRIGDIVVAKIADFGISKSTSGSDTTNTMTGIVGTIEYMAPEQILPEKFGVNGKVNGKADLWSFGILVYNWINSKSIYDKGNYTTGNAQMIKYVLDGIPKSKYNKIAEPYRKVLANCLIQNASKRNCDATTLIQLLNSEPEIIIDRKNIFKYLYFFCLKYFYLIIVIIFIIILAIQLDPLAYFSKISISKNNNVNKTNTPVVNVQNNGIKNADKPLVNTKENEIYSSFTDKRDGNVYKVVKIGNQIWMAENFRYNSKNSKCYPEKLCSLYGRIYPQEEAIKVCPDGWHLPTNNEFDELINYLGGTTKASILLTKDAKVGFNALTGLGTDDAGFYSSGSSLKLHSSDPIADFWSSTRTNWEMKPPYHYYIIPQRKLIEHLVEAGVQKKSIRYIKNQSKGGTQIILRRDERIVDDTLDYIFFNNENNVK